MDKAKHEESIYWLYSLHPHGCQNPQDKLIDESKANDRIRIDGSHVVKVNFVPYRRNTMA